MLLTPVAVTVIGARALSKEASPAAVSEAESTARAPGPSSAKHIAMAQATARALGHEELLMYTLAQPG
jgi:hypothetical protein